MNGKGRQRGGGARDGWRGREEGHVSDPLSSLFLNTLWYTLQYSWQMNHPVHCLWLYDTVAHGYVISRLVLSWKKQAVAPSVRRSGVIHVGLYARCRMFGRCQEQPFLTHDSHKWLRDKAIHQHPLSHRSVHMSQQYLCTILSFHSIY